MNNFGVSEMLGRLTALKKAVGDFAAREEKLNDEFRLQTAAAAATYDDQTKEQTLDFATRTDAEKMAFQNARQNCQKNFEKRKDSIAHVYSKARSRLVENVSRQENDLKTKIQQDKLETKNWREAEKTATDEALAAFDQKITQTRAEFAMLEANARKTFRGYGVFHKMLDEERLVESDQLPDENQMLAEVQRLMARVQGELDRGSTGFFGALFNRGKVAPVAAKIGNDLVKARGLLEAAHRQAGWHHQQEHARIEDEFTQTTEALSHQWRETIKWAIDERGGSSKIEEKVRRINQKNDRAFQAKLKKIEDDHAQTVAHLKQEAIRDAKKLAADHEIGIARLQSDYQAQWNALETEWKNTLQPLYNQIRAANAAAEKSFPEWNDAYLKNWNPPKEFSNAAKFGRLEVELDKFVEAMPKDKRLTLPGPANFSVPLSLVYPQEGSILFETTKTGGDEAVGVINNIIYRLLATTPPGKLSFTIFDPVGLGQNFAGLMHLADYEESNISSRIWTQPNQFEERLAELSEHMEKVIQMYLRNEYATITEYNTQAGTIAEKYHILVIASFPVNFSDVAAKRLRNIAASGARCGVYTLIHWDQRNQTPSDFVPDELRKNSVRLVPGENNNFKLANWRNPGTRLVLDEPPSPKFATQFLHEVGERSKDSNRVEVPFAQIAPAESEIWSEITTSELRVPIGRSGATKLQYLAIGKDTRQHALIAGKTGSGKSTLFHVIITNLSLWCSPEQVEFYLVDFKKGVEFKCYASRRLPHAKVVAIESDRDFGLSVLQRVDEELARRGDLFRELGAQDVAGYKRAGGTEPMPRSLLIIDEFQEFFTEEDRISQGAAVLLDRIVRQGRAFGIHVLLGSQTLGGAYTLARATIGQMVIRIALQCNEADAYLIMDQDNPAPRLLSRPGEGIYNDTAGSIEGNNPFQVVWLADTVRDDYLQKIRERAGPPAEHYPGPFVFEGNAPADVRENNLLNALLTSPIEKTIAPAKIWLGAPNAIKGPTEARFQRQSGSNLLIVGQNDEATLSILAVALISLAAQFPLGAARFVLLDTTAPDSPERDFLDRIANSISHEVTRVKSGDLTEIMTSLANDLTNRGDESQANGAPETFVLIHGLHNYKKLRQEDEFSFSSSGDSAAQPATILLNLIREGPARGIHVIVASDTYNNVNRFLGRKNLSEFEMRVLFQMSASDSASLIDSPAAATLGLHRALFYNDREGHLETFRPYAKPGNEWIEAVAQSLKTSRK